MEVSILPIYVLLFCRLTLILVFTASSLGKLRDITLFIRTVDAFDILPRGGLSRSVAIAFLIGEFASAILLLLDRFLAVGLLLSIGLLGVFTSALIITLKRKNRVPCNCFGSSNHPVSIYDVVRNLSFILCACLGWVALAFSGNSPLSLIEVGLLGLMAVVFISLMVNLDEIAKLFTAWPE